MRLASFVAAGRERWGFVVDDPATGSEWVLEPARAEAFLTAYASIPSSGLAATRPRFLGDGWPATLVEFLALEDAGMAALSRLVSYVDRIVTRSDAMLLPRAGYTVVNDVSGTHYYDIVPGNAGRGYSLPDGYDDWLYQATASWGGKKADTMAPWARTS